jgi:hypothetical protein
MMKYFKTVLILCAALFSGVRLNGIPSDSKNLPVRIANAVQWDAVWGRDELTCTNGKFVLSDQLKSSKSHTFGVETARYQDGGVALLPDFHRLVSIRLTPDQELASITIESTCESGLQSYYAKLKSSPKGQPVQDPRRQEHLGKLNQLSEHPNPEELKSEMGMLEIGVPAPGASPLLGDWPKVKVDALRSVEAAAQTSFEQECAKCESAIAEVPDFELYDPALLVVVTAKNGSCVLPVGFEHRQSDADAFIAYPKYHCLEDSKLLRKMQRLIRAHGASTKTLTCRRSRQ